MKIHIYKINRLNILVQNLNLKLNGVACFLLDFN